MARTKNRGIDNAVSPFTRQAPTWFLGKYLRLSKDDFKRGNVKDNRKDISDSIENQRKILNEFEQMNADEFEWSEEYKDDGFTGTDADRDDFQRLLADVRAGTINCVVVKDLSRLSRDYVEAGILIDRLFVQMNVRFISLHERIDSYKDPDSISNMVVPITNVMNDQYCYQTSKKIRQVFDYKRRNGEYIAPFAPHGYIKDPQDRHKLIVDPEAAEVVKHVFSMFLGGMSKNAIVLYLNEHGVLSPSEYKRSKGMVYKTQLANGGKAMWSTKMVDVVLTHPLYGAVRLLRVYFIPIKRLKSAAFQVHVQHGISQRRALPGKDFDSLAALDGGHQLRRKNRAPQRDGCGGLAGRIYIVKQMILRIDARDLPVEPGDGPVNQRDAKPRADVGQQAPGRDAVQTIHRQMAAGKKLRRIRSRQHDGAGGDGNLAIDSRNRALRGKRLVFA